MNIDFFLKRKQILGISNIKSFSISLFKKVSIKHTQPRDCDGVLFDYVFLKLGVGIPLEPHSMIFSDSYYVIFICIFFHILLVFHTISYLFSPHVY